MAATSISVAGLRQELRNSVGDYNRLSKLHAVITNALNDSYGEEKQMLTQLRLEVRELLRCRVPG